MKRYTKRSGVLLAGLCTLGLVLPGCDGGAENRLPPVLEVENPAYDPEAPVDPAVASNNALSVKLYQQLDKEADPGDNLFFSPASVSAALMLTYEGSRGKTQAEFEEVLSLKGGDRLSAHKAYAGMLGRLSGDKKPYELTVANALWGERTMPFRDEFLKTLRDHYAASFESVDFKRDYDTQRERINGWVEKRTKERIKDLLPEGSLDNMTRLVLVNAIYFKAPWSMEFSEHATKDQPFHLLPGPNADENKTVTVPLMYQGWERFMYGDFDGYNALSMHYKGYDLSMLVLLPDDRYGLPGLEKKLTAELIDKTARGIKPTLVNLWIPKWKTTRAYDLVPALKAMGLTDAFDERTADFTGVSDSADAELLSISQVRHKAFIAVDEEGTEAAAATAVALAETAAEIDEDKPIDFKCDHPFLYLIRDNRTGAILFMGRVTDPS